MGSSINLSYKEMQVLLNMVGKYAEIMTMSDEESALVVKLQEHKDNITPVG